MTDLGPPATSTGPITDHPPERPERIAASLAMVAFVLCSVVGPLLVFWWARRRSSPFARRYALLSLVLEIPILVGVVLTIPVAVLAPGWVSVVAFLVLWLGELALCVYAIVLAVGAGRGRDLADVPVPDVIVRLIADPPDQPRPSVDERTGLGPGRPNLG